MTRPRNPRLRLCADCSAAWQRALEPGRQPPVMFTLHHIGDPTGAQILARDLARADEYWARVRAWQDWLERTCPQRHAAAGHARTFMGRPILDIPVGRYL